LRRRERKTGNLSRCKVVKRRMRTDKVEEKDEHGNEIVSRIEGAEALLGFVPRLKLFIESLDNVV